MKKYTQLLTLLIFFFSYSSYAQIIHENNFNTQSGWDADYDFNQRDNFLHINSGGYNDSGYIEVSVFENEHYGGSLRYIFADNGVPEPQELYAQYKVYYEPSMSLYTGKAPGFSGTRNVCGWGNCVSDGTNGWSARGSINPNSSSQVPNRYYVYHKDMDLRNGTKTWGDTWSWSNNANMDHGKWYTVDQYIKVNDVGSSDGILRAWVDGELVYQKENIRFTTTANNNFDKVWAYWFNYYHGGSAVSPQDAYIRIDDFKLSGAPILSVENNEFISTKIFPNPTKGKITINGIPNLKSVDIYGVNGKLLISKKSNLKTFDISRLQAGIYFAKLRTGQSIKIVKIIKN